MKECPICQTGGRSRPERHLNDIALLKCGSCGFVYADLPDELILRANSAYDDEAEARYRCRQTFLDDMWFQTIAVRFTERLGTGSVLDVGCGNGRLLRQFRCLGWECYGVDISPWSTKFADRYGFELHRGTIEDAVSEIREVDLVVSSTTLEHIAQPVPHIQAIAHVLKAGGWAYFCGMPNYASIAVRLGLSAFHANYPPDHVNFFTAETLAKLFQVADVAFREVTIGTYGIPEFHRVYNGIAEIFRARQIPAVSDAPGQAQCSPYTPAAEPSGMKRVFGGFLLRTYYQGGRVGYAGDKLEALVRKWEGRLAHEPPVRRQANS